MSNFDTKQTFGIGTAVNLQGTPISQDVGNASTDDVLSWNGSEWVSKPLPPTPPTPPTIESETLTINSTSTPISCYSFTGIVITPDIPRGSGFRNKSVDHADCTFNLRFASESFGSVNASLGILLSIEDNVGNFTSEDEVSGIVNFQNELSNPGVSPLPYSPPAYVLPVIGTKSIQVIIKNPYAPLSWPLSTGFIVQIVMSYKVL